MTNKKIMSMLGMARRAGKLSMGHDMAMKAVKNSKANIIIFASDISNRLVSEFDKATQQYCPNVLCLHLDETINELYIALGYKAGVMTVDDKNFSNGIIKLLAQEENTYGNKG
jgi:ribosomal protein L7Ae-like RNA K-turn-binding protein